MKDEAQPADILSEDLSELLSEVWKVETFANNTRTQQFLEAGEQLLHQGLARDAGEEPAQRSSRIRAPFEELLAWVSRRRVVDEAERNWDVEDAASDKPTESAFRYRWRRQAGFLRDLVIYSLRHRMAEPERTKRAFRLFEAGDRTVDKLIDEITYNEIKELRQDKTFRLQMVFQAILSHDDQVANALRLVDRTNVEAWKEFHTSVLHDAKLQLRPDVTEDDLALALHVAAQGVVFRTLLGTEADRSHTTKALDDAERTSLLSKITMAVLVAFVDPGDGREVRDLVRDLFHAGTSTSSACRCGL
ncbi:hypothetical protein OHR68_34580 [Spirillospora sp. NBC_00431]